MAEEPGSISSIVNSVFSEYLSKKLDKDGNETKSKKHKSHKEKPKKHKRDKDKAEKDSRRRQDKDRPSKERRPNEIQSASYNEEYEVDNRSDKYNRNSEYDNDRSQYSQPNNRHTSDRRGVMHDTYIDQSQNRKSFSYPDDQSILEAQNYSPRLDKRKSDRTKTRRESPPPADTGFFAKEGFLETKSKKDKKHKKHKKENKSKSKKKDKEKVKSIDNLSFNVKFQEESSNSSGNDSDVNATKNEKADEFAKDLRQQLDSMKDNLTKKHKALEDINKIHPNQSKKIKLCTEISLVDKYGDKHDEQSPPRSSIRAKNGSSGSVADDNMSKPNGENRSVQTSGGKIQIQLSSISLPQGEPNRNSSAPDKAEVDEDGFKMMIPRSVKLSIAEDSLADEQMEAKPVPLPVPPPVKKTMNLKISALSATLISSGVKAVEPQKINMEDGELTGSEDSAKSSGSDVSSGSLSHPSSGLDEEDADGEIKKRKKKKEKKRKTKDRKKRSDR